MIERFTGAKGRKRLLSALCSQDIIKDNIALAEALLKKVYLQALQPGEILITQGNSDNDIYFVLSGKFQIIINGREIAVRSSGSHIGEMSLIDPSARRTATAVASEPSVVAKITESDFTRLANKYPILWRYLAIELAHRLHERDRFHVVPNTKPIIFIGSSSEMLPVAHKIKKGFSRDDFIVKVWTDGIFQPSSNSLDDLISTIQISDFAILILGQDDKVISRGNKSWAPRDNVIFELGMFIAVLGKMRTLVVKPRSRPLKIPSDLLGFNTINYELKDEIGMDVKVTPVCNSIRRVIQKYGPK
jgi:predicted nucleotide-binding protein